MPPDLDDAMARVVALVEPDARLVRTEVLAGGLSAAMVALEIERPGGSVVKLVVRRLRRPHSSSSSLGDEFNLVVGLRALGMPVPNPRLLDASGAIFGEPCAVFDHVDGSSRFHTDDPIGTGRIFATQLAAIHAVDVTRSPFVDLPQRDDVVESRLAETGDDLDETLGEGRIREALQTHWPPPAPDQLVLLHGDLWPGNVLWADDEVVAVIDWKTASIGDGLADVGITRLDLLWAFGARAMSAFTEGYLWRRPVDPAGLPVWDLVAALRPTGAMSMWAADWAKFGRPDVTPMTMRAAHHWFVDQAVVALGHQSAPRERR